VSLPREASVRPVPVLEISHLSLGVWDRGWSVDGMAPVPNIFGTQHDAHGLGNRSMIPMWHRDDAKPGLPRRSQGYRDEGGDRGQLLKLDSERSQF